ncbi:hypothetical protein CBA19C8_04165 [Paraburkholderia terrae]|jgi:hypothetical protein|nr:hypothetical protein CBA19C8_04165 [Paraburkholderia terrae]
MTNRRQPKQISYPNDRIDDRYHLEMHTRDLLVNLTIATGLMNADNRMAIGFRNSPQAAL